MPDLVLLQGAITSLKTAADLAIGLSKLNTLAEVQGKAVELQQMILAAQSSALTAQVEQFAQLERIRILEREIADVKAWDETKKRYALAEPSPGTFVYALREGLNEPLHSACTKCFDEGRRSILQLKTKGIEHDHYLCPTCDTEVKFRGTRSKPQALSYPPNGAK